MARGKSKTSMTSSCATNEVEVIAVEYRKKARDIIADLEQGRKAASPEHALPSQAFKSEEHDEPYKVIEKGLLQNAALTRKSVVAQ